MYGSTLPVTGPSFLIYGLVALVLGIASGVMFIGRKLTSRGTQA